MAAPMASPRIEDIVEMVVGDIEDEHDDEEVMFKRVSEDMFVADARVELEEIAEAIGPDFDIREQLDDVDTLGGLIFSELGRIPVRGEVVQAIPASNSRFSTPIRAGSSACASPANAAGPPPSGGGRRAMCRSTADPTGTPEKSLRETG
jgi:hypothetical protein